MSELPKTAQAELPIPATTRAQPMPNEELREKVARLIDPSKWRVLDGYLAEMLRKLRGQNCGYDPDNFRDQKSLTLADAILTLISEDRQSLLAEIEAWKRAHAEWKALAIKRDDEAQAAIAEAARLRDEVAGVLAKIAAVPATHEGLNYLYVNILHARGSLSKETRREAVVAIKTYRDILDAVRALSSKEPPISPSGASAGNPATDEQYLSSLNPPAQPEEAGE